LFKRKNLKTPKINGVPLPQARLCTMKYHLLAEEEIDHFILFTKTSIIDKKPAYMASTARSKILDSGFFDNQV
jgi:hypothetical protein